MSNSVIFRTMFSGVSSRVAQPHGDKYRKVLKKLLPFETNEAGECINKTRFVTYVDSGEVIDIQAQINSYLESTRIENVLKQLSNNQIQAININDSLPTEDLTILPKTLAEAKKSKALLDQCLSESQKILAKQKENSPDLVPLTASELQSLRNLISKGGQNNE